MNFENLEKNTDHQKEIIKWLLIYCAKNTVQNTSCQKDKVRRKKQLNNALQSFLKLQLKYSENDSDLFSIFVRQWWIEELNWYKQYRRIKAKDRRYGLIYRLQVVFFTNYMFCLFTKKGKPDNKEFTEENQKLSEQFIEESIEVISSEKKFSSLKKELRPLLAKMKKMDIAKEIEEASYELHGIFWKKLGGFVIGGLAVGASSLFLTPIAAGYIGSLAGLSGAAATSYGLALLGGGSLASGGFGMLGGQILGFTTFAIVGGASTAKNLKGMEKQTQMVLPLALAIGCVQKHFYKRSPIPGLIHEQIYQRLEELKSRSEEMQSKLSDSNKKNLNKTISLYEEAEEMSQSYDWYVE